MKKIIFVCTGNTCRSPMAEALFQQKIKQMNGKKTHSCSYVAESAGILVNSGSSSASANSIDVMERQYHIDISSYHPKQLTVEQIKEADMILCMERMQAEIIKYQFSLQEVEKKKIFTLLDYVGIGGDILDPYGGSYLDYLHTAGQIEKAIDLLVEKLDTKEKGGAIMIAIGADHGGFALKEQLLKYYHVSESSDDGSREQKEEKEKAEKIILKDYGAYDASRGLEEPEVALRVAEAVSKKECSAGILICRSGVGMVMAANKVKGIRCGLAYNESVARSIKEHNNANIIALGSDFTDLEQAIKLIDTWKNAQFLEGIYAERLEIVSKYEARD